ncbi:flagellar biosynthesis protein FlhF (Flagella-associated GTP-bindingprotein) [Treponema primitia ZAS-2]|uniref:Flagellar biosynthesis protein FlhF n=1 Tax=Treponema primitia (strain ATCC BAA-887 / DSM 12427 / ZAS-2) TaxID=545694 RepID=F5YPU7_TREPZ|nr:flagellar biosynthesis protein FlhF [Treponema primitia]AEF84130.1 flagellar biosynthesis protein FlhF (Flagella-associated GTP-bindingprotein) [Treponema primitia ZAS-2]
MSVEQFIEQGASYSECLQKVRLKYGERAKVMNYRTIRMGGFLGLFTREGVEMTGYISTDIRYATMGGYGASSSGLAQGARQPGQTSLTSHNIPTAQNGQTGLANQTLDFEEEKKKILAANNKTDPTLQKLLNEVKTLSEKLDANVRPQGEEHPTLGRLEEIFYQNDFSPGYTKAMLERVRKEFSLEDLGNYDVVQDKVVEWIGETIKIHNTTQSRRKSRILVLVGPTGVGKTTTIAKLAAAYGIDGWGRPPLAVRMITIDGYRIAAKEQLEIYGDIMGIPVSYVNTTDELRKTLAFYENGADLILVDTIGKSPRDAVKLGEMKQFLEVCGSSAEVHLALAASTKYSDIKEIIRQFAPFNFQSVVITKLDETVRVGNVISALEAEGKPVAYITDGQPVDKHIHRASVVRFLINLEGFRINREEIEQRFPPGASTEAAGRSSPLNGEK